MADIVNLRMERKRAARQRADDEAAANRLLHGRSKAERDRENVRREKAMRTLDLHRIETGDER